METLALYPGSFDPITYGHLDILERATELFDKVIITIAINNKKDTVFSGDEREALIAEYLEDKQWAERVEIQQFTGLLVDFAKQKNAQTLVRGCGRFPILNMNSVWPLPTAGWHPMWILSF
ncbi:MAG: adenylyltransferase/cytidyltransferase family protein [Fodinibius sp.]|nr:adenylyltransferase/cytidyltransferase family protein [Fodinibius sp.]